MTTEEDVFISDVISGPTVGRDYANKKFYVEFNTDSKEFFTGRRSELKIVHTKYSTVGEANRGYIHELLDHFIDDLIKGTITPRALK